jgi:transcriptional regulator with XRE-family HTH domain
VDKGQVAAEASAGSPRRRKPREGGPAAFPALEPLARRLEALRLQRGLTQRGIAKRAQISANHYQNIAHANANPGLTVLLRLVGALGVSVADLFEPPLPDGRRLVLRENLTELADAQKQFVEVVARLSKGLQE